MKQNDKPALAAFSRGEMTALELCRGMPCRIPSAAVAQVPRWKP